jgi:hypothetical protein
VTERSTLQLLRSLAWLRWRLTINAITRSGARDFLERLSRSAESLLPIAILVLITPAALILGAVGTWGGWALAAGNPAALLMVEIVRWILATVLVMTMFAPLVFAAGQQASGMMRLLLLPFPRHVLYLSHTLGPLADPWIVIAIPMLVGVAAGLAAGGATTAALTALAAAVLMVTVLLGISALVSAALQLIVRNRRRAELLVLGGTLFVIVLSLMPSAFIEDTHGRVSPRPGGASADRSVEAPRWLVVASNAVPSEAYTRLVRGAATGRPAGAAALAVLAAWALLAHGLTWPLFQRMLQAPATSGRTRGGSAERAFGAALPGAGPIVSAVAIAFTRLAFRTPRGRTLVLAPILMLVLFAFITIARGAAIPFGPARVGGGFSLAIFGIGLAILSLGPFMFNQFAVDRAGLTLEFLAPIGLREMLYGKAIGGALVAAAPVVVSIVAGVLTGGQSPIEWATLLLATCAVYLTFAPTCAILSLMFPRSVDLSSIGQASNAHQAAGLLGTLALAAIVTPPSLLAAAGLRVWHSPLAALGLVFGWLLVSIGVALVLFRVAERLLEDRRENLLMVAVGR